MDVISSLQSVISVAWNIYQSYESLSANTALAKAFQERIRNLTTVLEAVNLVLVKGQNAAGADGKFHKLLTTTVQNQLQAICQVMRDASDLATRIGKYAGLPGRLSGMFNADEDSQKLRDLDQRMGQVLGDLQAALVTANRADTLAIKSMLEALASAVVTHHQLSADLPGLMSEGFKQQHDMLHKILEAVKDLKLAVGGDQDGHNLTPVARSNQELQPPGNCRTGGTECVALHTSSTWLLGSAANKLFYQCKLLVLELSDSTSLSLAFDARGESDLRDPSSSTLAVVTLAPRWRRAGTGLPGFEVPGTADKGARPFEEVHLSCEPQAMWLCARQKGHYKGVLRWSKEELLATLAAGLNRALVFCYASNLGSAGKLAYQGSSPDYSTAVLLQVHEGHTFAEVWRSHSSTIAQGDLEENLAAETLQCERLRWADRPSWLVSRRSSWWPQHISVAEGWEGVNRVTQGMR